MNFEELQKEWQAIQSKPRSHDELRRMMYRSPALRFRKMEKKEILAFTGKAAVIIAVIVLFDLFKNWSSGIFVVWSIFLFLDETLGLRYLRLLPHRDSIQQTLQESLVSIRKVVLVSRLAHVLIWLSAVLVIGLTSQASALDMLLRAVILLPVLAMASWWSSRKWTKKMAEVKDLLKEFSEEPEISMGT